MDRWILKGEKQLVNEPSGEKAISPTQVKVKVSHLLLSDFDALIYGGRIKTEYPRILGRNAIGIVTDVGEKCYGLEKNMRVFLNPTRPCGTCLHCLSGKTRECISVMTAGKDFDGFMRDFVVCEYNEVSPLPSSVDDFRALCIETVAIAENIYDRLNLSTGNRVAIIGGNFGGNIVAQVLMYHKIIPILIDNNADSLDRAKKSGVSHAFLYDDELNENVKNVTCGNMCDASVYCAESHLPLALASRVLARDRAMAICCLSELVSGATLDPQDIVKKNISIFGLSNAMEYTNSAINMLVYGALNLDMFEKNVMTEYDPSALLEEKLATIHQDRKSCMNILKMIL